MPVTARKVERAKPKKAGTRRKTQARRTARHHYTESPVSGAEYQVIVGTNNEPAFVMVPYDEYLKLIGADKSDEQLHAEGLARDEETFPADVVERIAIGGENPIKVYRKYRGLTQAQLAGQLEISPMYLSQIERGERKGSTKLLIALARALRVDLDDLV